MAELGETRDPRELIKGNPEAVEENVRVLTARAERAGDAADGLTAIDTGAWTGDAATKFHDTFSYEPTKWIDSADAIDAAATAMENYVTTLRWAQTQAAEAIRLWDQGERATRQAQAAHDSAVAQADQQNQANAVANSPAPCVTVAPFSDPGEADRQAARDTLTRAREQLRQVGDESAQILRDQTPPEDGDFWGDMGHGALDIAGFIPGVGEAADLTNAAWYAAEGKTGQATLAAAAAVPFVGWGAGAAKVGKWGDEALGLGKGADEAAAIAQGASKRSGYRPTRRRVKLRAGTKRSVIEAAPRTPGGDFVCQGSGKIVPADRTPDGALVRVDPETGKADPNGMTVPRKDSFDFGHRTGNEWKHYKVEAEAGGYSRERVISDQQRPDIYEIQDRSYNRSHQGEAPKPR